MKSLEEARESKGSYEELGGSKGRQGKRGEKSGMKSLEEAREGKGREKAREAMKSLEEAREGKGREKAREAMKSLEDERDWEKDWEAMKRLAEKRKRLKKRMKRLEDERDWEKEAPSPCRRLRQLSPNGSWLPRQEKNLDKDWEAMKSWRERGIAWRKLWDSDGA